jgi:murein peptide amidase A
MRWILLLMLSIVGCAASSTSRDVPTALAKASTTVIGHSVQRRPIEMHAFNTGDRPVLIMGAIHGNEPTSAVVAQTLVKYLRQNPKLIGATPLVIIPLANPDGYSAGTRTNANRIDLNRNFPAANFGSRPSGRSRNNFGGASSASEPETAALISTIEHLRPRLIISIHSMEKPCNNYDGPAQHIADLMSRYNHYPTLASIGYPTPGSMGSWAGIDKQIPMITLELPRRASGEEAWRTNRDALVAAINAMR